MGSSPLKKMEAYFVVTLLGSIVVSVDSKIMSFSPSQQAHYRPLVLKAWLAHCESARLDPENNSAYTTWYRLQLLEAAGMYTTIEADQVRDFERIMGHFAALAGDEFWIKRCAEGDERRIRYLISTEMLRGSISAAYLAGICRKMGFRSGVLSDLPERHLWKLWNALFRHNRRHTTSDVKE
ncbi:MAG: hypothetical protein HY343_00660 [Lentisphaerae bacterium]|nr:hypothetical protein [Lentisphaerota bacterium]